MLSGERARCMHNLVEQFINCLRITANARARTRNYARRSSRRRLNPAHSVPDLSRFRGKCITTSLPISAVPSAWFLALKYVGNGHEFDGPGAMAIDAAGNVWANNNYVFKADHTVPTLGGKQLLELTPVGNDAPGAPFTGGGINGVGWGIALDAQNNVWLGNFGFAGKHCKNKPPANSVSEMDSSGHPISPKTTGFTDGSISRPQATTRNRTSPTISGSPTTATNRSPNIPARITRRRGGSGISASTIRFRSPSNARGDIWITSSANDSAVALRPDGRPLPGSPYTGGGIMRPLGGALDSRGNFWISNSTGDSVTALDDSGKPLSATPFTGGGVRLPVGNRARRQRQCVGCRFQRDAAASLGAVRGAPRALRRRFAHGRSGLAATRLCERIAAAPDRRLVNASGDV